MDTLRQRTLYFNYAYYFSIAYCILLFKNVESKNEISLFPENKTIVASGKLIYNDQCASCHINLQGHMAR